MRWIGSREGTAPLPEIARAAHAVETVHLGRQCGIQDQLCAAFGGANFIKMVDTLARSCRRCRCPNPIRRELDRRLALIYLAPRTVRRPSTKRSSEVWSEWVRTALQLDALRAAAEHARDALLAGDLDALGSAMRDNTVAQADLHPDLVHDDAWRRDRDCPRSPSVAGWKVNGAGGDGGSITVLASAEPGSEARAGARAITRNRPGAIPIPIAISRDGLRVW